MDKKEQLAYDILDLSRSLLLIRLRFLEPAFLQLMLVPDPEGTFSTDGFSIFYSFHHVLRRYEAAPEQVTFDYLHMVLHCLFHHPFTGPATDRIAWDTASDIAVTAVILDLDLPYVKTAREERQREMLEALKKDVPLLTAERLYHFFREIHAEPERLLTLRGLFESDDHELWYRHSRAGKEQETEELIPSPDEPAGDEAEENAEGRADPDADEEGTKRNASSDSSAAPGQAPAEEPNAAGPSGESPQEAWRDISGKVQTDLETLSEDFGEKAGSILKNLREVTRERYDYGEFLRQFAAPCEVLKTSEEEFDYIYYTYGLRLYENVPLVEPLEYSDQKRIRDFVIVIDTSASVDGELVQAFIQKTWNLLKDTETFTQAVNVHLIQCDAAVQEDTVIRSPEDLDPVLAGLSLRGFGGTDFRPAFEYTDQLLREGTFQDLQGLIYFTDGDGIYPEEMPDYKAAFVFLEDQYEDRDVPVWAIKIILEKDEGQL